MSISCHLEILPKEQKKLFELLSTQSWLKSFYLVGGTALALQIGHRQSKDFDFFTNCSIENRKIISLLNKTGRFELYNEAENTINGSINNIKISILTYSYPLLRDKHTYSFMSMADIFDIALMKISAISGRGAKKYFIDLYFLLRQFSLSELLGAYKLKFGGDLSNLYHLKKSLVYFDDAEHGPMPKMLKTVDWEEIKEFIISKVKELGV